MGRSVCWGENTFTPSCLCFMYVPCVECLFCALRKAQDCRGPWELDWGPAGELLVELPWVQSSQKGACPGPGLETPSQKMFSIIWRKLEREISTSFSLKPFTPMLYLFCEDIKGCFCFPRYCLPFQTQKVYKPWWAGKEGAEKAGDNWSALKQLFINELTLNQDLICFLVTP